MPMDSSRYPTNWGEIAMEVKNKANWECQECGRPCRRPGERWEFFSSRAIQLGWFWPEESAPQQYTLTVAHLDQDPGNNDPFNLKALCAPCHLRYDAPFRKANSMAKRERAGQLPLLGGANDELA